MGSGGVAEGTWACASQRAPGPTEEEDNSGVILVCVGGHLHLCGPLGSHGIAEGARPCPSQWAPDPAEREDNCEGMGRSSVTCRWEAGKGKILATGSGWMPKKGSF